MDYIHKSLLKIGVPANIKGFRYLHDAIDMAIDTPDILECVTKGLYPSVAENNDTTGSRVERAIRHVIEVAWMRGDAESLDELFGYSCSPLKGKPTNSEFIAVMALTLAEEAGK